MDDGSHIGYCSKRNFHSPLLDLLLSKSENIESVGQSRLEFQGSGCLLPSPGIFDRRDESLPC
jgi:hypothetical protein